MSLNEQKYRDAFTETIRKTESKMVKAVLENILKSEDFNQVLSNIMEDTAYNEYFETPDDARAFYFGHYNELDDMLRLYDNTSIGKMIMEFFEEMAENLACAGFEHVLRRVLEKFQ